MVEAGIRAHSFLRDGGTMGALMGAIDWARTPLGPLASWPQSLKTAVSLMLRARQPVFIAWGPALVSLYNDGYIPICGAKHPDALGRPMREVWAEIWDTLDPINQAVLRGESQWFENMPFELAGRAEGGTSYFSFSYTPLLDDDGAIGGIFCAATETTSTLKLARRRADDMQRRQRLFEQAPGFICTLSGPQHVFEFVNDAHRRLFRRPDIIGKTIREAFPDIAGQGIYELLDNVYATGERHVARDLKARLRDAPGEPEREVLLDFIFAPVLEDDGTVSGIFCEGQDVTAAHAARLALRAREEQLRLATDAAEMGFWDADTVTGSVYWSPRLREMFGITGDGPLTLADHRAALHPDDAEATMRALARACDPAVRALYDVEYRAIGRDDGRVRWIASRGRGHFDDSGRCIRAVGTAIDITARKAAEQRMEVALAASRAGTFHWNIENDRLWWDAALDELFGLRPGEAVHGLEQFIALVHPDDRAGVIERCQRCKDEAADFEMEFRVIHPDGSVRWLYDRGRTLVDAAGQARTMTGACVDITDRKHAEAALRASELFYRRTLESVPGMTFSTTDDGTCDYVSEQWMTYTGRPADQQLGFGWLEALHPDDKPRALTAWREAVRSGQPLDVEYRVRRHDGVYQWFKARGRMIAPTGDLPARWIGSLLNVNDMKEAQAALQARERELRTVADNSPDVIARFDRGLRHVFVNAEIERLTGLPMALFLGRTSRELGMPGALCEQWERALVKVFEERRPHNIQYEMDRQGHMRQFATRVVPEIGPSGQVDHVLAVTRDVTDAWLAQEALRRADRQKDDFLATLAHELRNPLAPLRTGLRVLERREGTPEERRVRQIMDRQLTHVVRLVDELLDIARISQGKIVLRREVLQLQDVIEHAIDACRPLVEANGHTLSLAPIDPQWHVHGDVTRLVQVFSNILNNAAKYTPPGGHIAVRAEQKASELLVTVEDDGVGIPPDLLGRIFERFVQSEQHLERSQGGLGIGLSVVRSLVEMHGGRVAAESAGPGSGSSFQVSLPRVQVQEQRSDATDGPAAAPGQPADRRRILVVDDNADAAETLAMVIGLEGHEVLVAANGPEALQVAAAHRPDVVFLDIGMPGMSGYEVAARLRALPRGADLLLVALTGWGSQEDRARSQSAGFDLHLTKPVDIGAIERVLATRRSHAGAG